MRPPLGKVEPNAPLLTPLIGTLTLTLPGYPICTLFGSPIWLPYRHTNPNPYLAPLKAEGLAPLFRSPIWLPLWAPLKVDDLAPPFLKVDRVNELLPFRISLLACLATPHTLLLLMSPFPALTTPLVHASFAPMDSSQHDFYSTASNAILPAMLTSNLAFL